MRSLLLALGLGLLAAPAHAQTPFQITLTNTGAASWDQGVLAILPFDVALMDIGQSPTSGDPYDTYAYTHAACDPYGVEDDGDAALLISRWAGLTEGVNAFRVGPLGPGASQVVSFTASPGQVMSFVAHVTGSGDDAAIMHALGDRSDATVDLFDGLDRPLAAVGFGINGYDVNDNGAGGSCAATCPPPVPCYVAPGGGANGATAQPSTGGCTAQIWYADGDGDGVGNGGLATSSCEQPPGTAPTAGDCDDGNPNVWASCGSCVDSDADTFWAGCDAYDTVKGPDCDDADVDNYDSCATCQDADGDGVYAGCDAYVVRPGPDCDDGDADNWASCVSCVDGDGDGDWVGCDRYQVRSGPDCDDANAGLNTGTTWYEDLDGDLWGDDATASTQCLAPSLTSVLVGGDCADGDPAVHPGATEVCGGGDEDCDGLTDDADPSRDPTTASTWYADVDQDGHGDPSGGTVACVQPPGTVVDGTDCDDADTDNWTACPTCVDGDGDGSWVGCDRYVVRSGPDCDDGDAALNDGTTWYDDGDGDGYGPDASATVQCVPPGGAAVLLGGDCDDANPGVHPAATEVCGGGDEDCDGLVDDADPDRDPATALPWYEDGDGDGYGYLTTETLACEQPVGAVTDGTDCDDADIDNWASCNSCVDLDVDGSYAGCDAYTLRDGPDCDDADPLRHVSTVWYDDLDGDGWGDDLAATIQCDPPADAVLVPGDCDDADPTVSPGATEVCGGGDEDCNGLVDDGDPGVDPASTPTWYADVDLDGYGDGTTGSASCLPPPDTVADGTDCDDADIDNWASCSTCADGDGDGAWAGCDAYTVRSGPDCDDTDPALNDGTVWYTDGDGDGAGDPATAVVQCTAPPTGAVLVGGDCDDLDPTAFPGATEVCGGGDEDCDGLVDDADPDVDPTTRRTWYLDGDFDGRGDPASAVQACLAPPNHVSVGDDCDDSAGDVFPGAPETCDGRDEDCDGTPDNDAIDAQLWYADGDGDGHGDGPTGRLTCDPDPTDVQVGDDCDDADANTFPGALEFCDGRDQDCDAVPDNDAVDASQWYVDGDLDGYGDDGQPALLCGAQAGYASAGGDCDDADPDTWPGAPELCDGVDNDCDGDPDEDLVFDTWWADEDGDGFGDAEVPLEDCAQPVDSADNDQDCDDDDPDVHPDGIEVPDNGIDEDCDGLDAHEDTGFPGTSDRDWTAPAPTDVEDLGKAAGCDCDQGGGPSGAGLGLVVLLGLIRRRRGA